MIKYINIILIIISSLFSQQEENTIYLHSGANAISFYVIPENNSITNVLSPLENNNYNSLFIQESAASALFYNGIWIGSLQFLSPLSGYWLIIENSTDLTLTGTPMQPNQIYSLHYGANFISYPLDYNLDINGAFTDEELWNINGILGEGIAAININGQFIGSLTKFEKNHGYWFIVNSPFDLSYNNYTIPECHYHITQAQEELETIFFNMYNNEEYTECAENLINDPTCFSDIFAFEEVTEYYEQVLELCPTDPAANFGAAIVSLMSIISNAELNDLINRWFNYFTEDGNDLLRFSGFNMGVPSNESSYSDFNFSKINQIVPNNITNFNNLSNSLGRENINAPYLQELQELIEDVLLSKVNAALQQIDFVVNTNYNFIVTGEMQGDVYQNNIEMDDTEFYLIKAYLHFFNALFYSITTYDVSEITIDFSDFLWMNKESSFLTIRDGYESHMPMAHTELNNIYNSLNASINYLKNENDWQENDYIHQNTLNDNYDQIMEDLNILYTFINEDYEYSIEGCLLWDCDSESTDFWSDLNCNCIGETVELENTFNISNFMHDAPQNLKEYVPDYTITNGVCEFGNISTSNEMVFTTNSGEITSFSITFDGEPYSLYYGGEYLPARNFQSITINTIYESSFTIERPDENRTHFNWHIVNTYDNEYYITASNESSLVYISLYGADWDFKSNISFHSYWAEINWSFFNNWIHTYGNDITGSNASDSNSDGPATSSFPCPLLTWSATTYEEWVEDWEEIDVTINGLFPKATIEDILFLYHTVFNINENSWNQTIGGH